MSTVCHVALPDLLLSLSAVDQCERNSQEDLQLPAPLLLCNILKVTVWVAS